MIKSSERQGSKSGMPWLFSFFFAIVLQLNRCCPTIRKGISESVVSNICRKSTFFFFLTQKREFLSQGEKLQCIRFSSDPWALLAAFAYAERNEEKRK